MNQTALWSEVIDVLFPISCLGCRVEGELFCQSCLEKIKILISKEVSCAKIKIKYDLVIKTKLEHTRRSKKNV